ncbi:MAG: histidine--tRNA ligase [Proteobacteria bacterium]|nr:histidine--tRNA ligase [Desulfobulbaceae bacterium]MBU4153513.1 histidine--tRNA ligase [Pseudomonadota bacterium]MDP2104970.1 histidine--tRNA ligase [Desulfobulbaceae bacterium]
MNVTALKGFKDILPEETLVWQRIETTARDVFRRFGFREIKVPILEKTALFARSIGETTDIVEKEMYTFTDRNGDSITMRPEGTAPVLRSFIEHSLHNQQPVQKLFTFGPMFRHERPQKGRLRQFHQISVEALGANQPELDAEIMAMASMILTELGLVVSLEINSLGCPQCRPGFNQALLAFLADKQDSLCEDCQRRREKNPLRVLDCKSATCQSHYQEAPSIIDHLCSGCSSHFQIVQNGLIAMEIPYAVNSFMVRGLDYYTRTTFELITDALGAQSAVGAGGRYDGLIKQLGGPDLPGIGFAMGMERLVLLLQQQESNLCQTQGDLFIAARGDKARTASFTMAHGLRRLGMQVIMEYAGASLKSQMKQADRHNCRYTLIIGDEEMEKGEATLRNMLTRDQDLIKLPDQGIKEWCTMLIQKLYTA